MSDIEQIASFSNSFDAELAIAHLASEDIEAFMTSDDAGGVLPSMSGLGGGVRVLVRRDDAARARLALDSLET
jgi:Putative prokaryotic signal transducing protein